jgi:hypothetical protein
MIAEILVLASHAVSLHWCMNEFARQSCEDDRNVLLIPLSFAALPIILERVRSICSAIPYLYRTLHLTVKKTLMGRQCAIL